MLNSPTLLEVWRRHLTAAGVEEDPMDPNAGSTDMANVSHEVPTIHPYLSIAPHGTPGHSREFAAYAGGPEGDATLERAITILAATAIDLIREPALIDRAWSELRAQGGGRAGEAEASA
jgi:metal-dependent amidase/aminoacylase/carboxypeptidase family protein